MVSFPSKAQVAPLISKDLFFHRLSKTDLCVRRHSNQQAYLQTYIDSIQPFSMNEKELLTKSCRALDDKCKSMNLTKLLQIPWTLVKVSSTIENGYPHTLGSYIMLPDGFCNAGSVLNQMQTLMHEKIHVYQRLFPFETSILIVNFWHYNVVNVRHHFKRIRGNPDVDEFVYSRNGDYGDTCTYEYSEEASSISEVVKKGCANEYEHPYEKMAYTISEMILKPSKHHIDDHITASNWMKKYLSQ